MNFLSHSAGKIKMKKAKSRTVFFNIRKSRTREQRQRSDKKYKKYQRQKKALIDRRKHVWDGNELSSRVSTLNFSSLSAGIVKTKKEKSRTNKQKRSRAGRDKGQTKIKTSQELRMLSRSLPVY